RGREFANDASELVEESRTRASQAATASGHAEILAGEASADEVNGSEVCRSDCSHVVMLRNPPEVLTQNGLCLRVNLNLPRALHAGSLHRQIEAADAREQ